MAKPSGVRLLCPVVVSYMFYASNLWIDADLTAAWMRTLIKCDSTGPHATPHCKEQPEDCVPRSPDSEDWSGSAFCFDKQYVLKQAVQLGSTVFSIELFFQVLALPILSGASDTYGRKPFMMLTMVFLMLGTICFLCASNSANPMPWVLASAVAQGVDCFDASALSMASDLSDPDSRGDSIAAMFFCRQFSIAAAFALGFVILSMNLTDYTVIWIAATGFLIIGLLSTTFTLKETRALVPSEGQSSSLWAVVCKVKDNFRQGCAVLSKDRFLKGYVPIIVLTYASLYGTTVLAIPFLIGGFGYSQAVASLAGVCLQPFMMSGVGLASYTMRHPKIGPNRTYSLCLLLSAMLMCLMGLSPLLLPFGKFTAQLAWWCCFCLLGVPFAMLDTSQSTLASLRVTEENQNKLQGVIQIGVAMGRLLGIFIFGHLGLEGYGYAKGFIYASGCAALSFLAFTCLLSVADTTPPKKGNGQDVGLLTG